MVLFDVDRFVLKPEAEDKLAEAAKRIGEYVGATLLIDTGIRTVPGRMSTT